MEMTLYEFILGMAGTFFVLIPALGLLIYAFIKELKKSEQSNKELKIYHEEVLEHLQNIALSALVLSKHFIDLNDEEPK